MPAPAGGDLDLEALWRGVVEAVGRVSTFTRSYLAEAHPVSLEKKVFTIGFAAAVADHIMLVDNPKNQTLLQTKLAELGHPGVSVKFVPAEPSALRVVAQTASPVPVAAPANPAPAAAKPVAATKSVPFSKDDFKNDPLIQKALEIFKGQIVDVRN